MSNQIQYTYEPLVQLLEDAADGANKYAAVISLKQNTEPAIRTDLAALTGTPAGPGGVPPAVPGLKNLWNTAKVDKVAATAAFRSAQSNGRALAMTCIGTLKPVLGQQWNSAWNAAGFIGGSLAVPTNPLPKLQQLRGYYEKNPGQEVANVNGVACTAAACEAAAQAISTAESASNQSNTDAGTAQANYQAGITTARNRASGLLAELAPTAGRQRPALAGVWVRDAGPSEFAGRAAESHGHGGCGGFADAVLPLGRCAARGRLPGGVGECRRWNRGFAAIDAGCGGDF